MLAILGNAKPALMECQLADRDRLRDQLADLAERARLGLAALPDGPGRNTVSLSPHGRKSAPCVSARDFCAIVAFEAYLLVRGKEPGVHNPDASAVAGLVWKAAGGEDTTAEAQSWARHLTTARDITLPKDAALSPRRDDPAAILRWEVRMALPWPRAGVTETTQQS
jgi:hypothetical protein